MLGYEAFFSKILSRLFPSSFNESTIRQFQALVASVGLPFNDESLWLMDDTYTCQESHGKTLYPPVEGALRQELRQLTTKVAKLSFRTRDGICVKCGAASIDHDSASVTASSPRQSSGLLILASTPDHSFPQNVFLVYACPRSPVVDNITSHPVYD
eukprot:g45292.t1